MQKTVFLVRLITAQAKPALVGLSGAIAKEYGIKGITSNVVVPGMFETDMGKGTLSENLRKFWLLHNPMKRMGTWMIGEVLCSLVQTPQVS